MNKALIGVVAVVAIGGIYLWTTYNRLVGANEEVTNQWAQVETQYQRRVDLIPNLVESVKGVMGQEQKVFGDLAAARSAYSGAVTSDQKAQAATQVEGSLGRLLAIMENYPQLKSADTVQTLMAQLEGSENRVSVARNRYNDLAKELNVTIKRFPTNLVAGMLGYSERSYFQADQGAAVAPKVDLQINK